VRERGPTRGDSTFRVEDKGFFAREAHQLGIDVCLHLLPPPKLYAEIANTGPYITLAEPRPGPGARNRLPRATEVSAFTAAPKSLRGRTWEAGFLAAEAKIPH
jgi:hypothetical protein